MRGPDRRIATVVLVVALFTAACGSSGGGSAPAGTSSVPAAAKSFVPTVAGLHRVQNATSQQLESGLRKALAGTDDPVFPESSDVAVYLDASGYTAVVVIAARAADSATVAKNLSTSARQDALLNDIEQDSSAVGARDFPPAPTTGRLQCATAALSGSTLTQCVWMTASTLGQVVAFPTAPASARTLTGLAAITRTMHAAYEG